MRCNINTFSKIPKSVVQISPPAPPAPLRELYASNMMEKQSKLMELPIDVRLYIFEIYLLGARPPQGPKYIDLKNPRSIRVHLPTFRKFGSYWIFGRSEDPRHNDWFGSKELTRLLRVNKTICAEVTALIYSTFCFEFLDTEFVSYEIKPWFEKIGSRKCAMIRSIRAFVGVNPPFPPGQKDALEYLRDTLPNLNRIEFLPLINSYNRGPYDLTPAEQTMGLFEYFPNVVTWNVQHPLEFEPGAQPVYIEYVLMPVTEREDLQQRLKKRNMEKATMQRS